MKSKSSGAAGNGNGISTQIKRKNLSGPVISRRNICQDCKVNSGRAALRVFPLSFIYECPIENGVLTELRSAAMRGGIPRIAIYVFPFFPHISLYTAGISALSGDAIASRNPWK